MYPVRLDVGIEEGLVSSTCRGSVKACVAVLREIVTLRFRSKNNRDVALHRMRLPQSGISIGPFCKPSSHFRSWCRGSIHRKRTERSEQWPIEQRTIPEVKHTA